MRMNRTEWTVVRALLALALAVPIFALPIAAAAQAFRTEAQAAYVVDRNTGQVLLAHNADVPLPPASMSKMMTLLIAFEAIADGRLTLDTRLPVSQHAMDYGGSTMFLNTSDRPTVEELILGVVVVSGNDASTVLAEALSPDGTEAGFARVATERARELGMAQTHLLNANGWPAAGHVMSMRDLVVLAERIIAEHPDFYRYFAITEFDYADRSPANRFNRNPLLGLDIGADGLKTGQTQEAGYGLTGSAVQGGRRVTFAITGLPDAAARSREAERILNWAFRQFVEREAAAAGVEVARARVFMGAARDVGLAPADRLTVLTPAGADGAVAAEVSYTGPIAAPIAKGDVLAELVLRPGGEDGAVRRVPLVATEDVAQGGPVVRLATAARDLLRRALGPRPDPADG